MTQEASPFSLEQVQALFRACRMTDSPYEWAMNYALVSVLLDTGLSATEVATLSVKRLQIQVAGDEAAYVIVSPKGHDQYKAWLGQHARKALALYLERRPSSRSVALFVDDEGEPLTAQVLRRLIAHLGDYEPLDGVAVTASAFRATYLAESRRLGAGVSVLDAFDAANRRKRKGWKAT